MTIRIDKLENFLDRQKQHSLRNCLSVYGIAETNDKDKDNLVLKTIDDVTENEI